MHINTKILLLFHNPKKQKDNEGLSVGCSKVTRQACLAGSPGGDLARALESLPIPRRPFHSRHYLKTAKILQTLGGHSRSPHFPAYSSGPAPRIVFLSSIHLRDRETNQTHRSMRVKRSVSLELPHRLGRGGLSVAPFISPKSSNHLKTLTWQPGGVNKYTNTI